MSEELLPAKAFPVEEIRPVPRGWILFSFLFYWLSIIGGILCIGLFVFLINKSIPQELKPPEIKISQQMNPSGNDAGNNAVEIKEEVKSNGEKKATSQLKAVRISSSVKIDDASAVTLKRNVGSTAAVGVIFLIYGMMFVILVCGLPMLIVFFTTVHRSWRCMQCLRVVAPLQATSLDTPSTVVGLLCCPYFNMYWMFPALLRLEKYGRILAEKRNMAYRGPESSSIILFLVFNLCIMVPVIGWCLALIVSPFLGYSLMKKLNLMIEDLGKPGMIPLSE